MYNFQKSKLAFGSSVFKATPSEQTGKHTRTNSATRYAQTTQKPTLAKSQSVEEIRKKVQVSSEKNNKVCKIIREK